jgi:hypothetical protein
VNGETFSRISGQWELIKKVCKQGSVKVAALLAAATPLTLEAGDPLVVVIAVGVSGFHYDKLTQPDYKQKVEWAITQVTDFPCQARFIPEREAGNYTAPAVAARPDASPTAPPVTAVPAPAAIAEAQARQTLEPEPPPAPRGPDPQVVAGADAVVQALQREFGARVAGVRLAGEVA